MSKYNAAPGIRSKEIAHDIMLKQVISSLGDHLFESGMRYQKKGADEALNEFLCF